MIELSALLAKALRQIPPSDQLTEQVVFAAWKPSVGAALAKRTRPFHFYKSTLIVAVPSQTWHRELQTLKQAILSKLQATLGQKVVRALEFRVDPEFDPPVKPAASTAKLPRNESVALPLESIQDPELSRAMAAAASNYFNRPR